MSVYSNQSSNYHLVFLFYSFYSSTEPIHDIVLIFKALVVHFAVTQEGYTSSNHETTGISCTRQSRSSLTILHTYNGSTPHWMHSRLR